MRRLFTSRVALLACAAFLIAFIVDVIRLQVSRPRIAVPEQGYTFVERGRFNRAAGSFFVSGADLAFEWLLFAGAAGTGAASLMLRKRGR